MKPQTIAVLAAVLAVACVAIPSESDQYAGMAALETEAGEWNPTSAQPKVADLGEAQDAKSPPSTSQTAYDSNADVNNPTSLFPGPTKDLPGYKASHDWVKDIDWFSPLVFDWRYYKARCHSAEACKDLDDADGTAMSSMTEDEVRNHWVETGMERCDVASSTFSAQYYVSQNPELSEQLVDGDTGKPLCKKAVEHFLTEGVFDGLSGTTHDGHTFTEGPSDKLYWQPKENTCHDNDCTPGKITWDKNYAWTFWYQRNDANRRQISSIFAVRNQNRNSPHGWWGGYPYFGSAWGCMMFCGSTHWSFCHWPIGEENSGIKGGYRYDWWHRWRLPPVHWWRFYGVTANQDGWVLYEFSDPPIKNNNNMNTGHKTVHGTSVHWTVHGFSRKIPMQASGSWWGHSWSTSMRYTDFSDTTVYSGYAMPDYALAWWGWHPGRTVPEYVMDLTYYRMGDHVMTEEEMKAIYIKGRSTDRVTGYEKTGAARS
eukprot:TRINITY_DN3662_c0_g1_i10.p1 TRINITY_DN3662_c0_g1~~TRINITY_DN3662_c0_g1_i10.p1  ORF type:complete len:484 (+),score=89.64 TRINITY_DN3662_c0_g1_i10:48-1499(+)